MIERLVERGEIGGRTVQIAASGDVECATYPPPRPGPGQVLVRSVCTAISRGTEMTFHGREATNVYLHKSWDPELRLFSTRAATLEYPLTFGYRASGEVVESRLEGVAVGTRVYGNWRHTEYTLRDASASANVLPEELTHDDGVDLAQMAPICLNAVLSADGGHERAPLVVFGAGVIGLITAQLCRALGAADVRVVDRLAGRLAIAAQLGFGTVQAADGRDVAQELKRELGAEAVPVTFECTGSTLALNEAIRTVRRRGTVVAVGFYQGEARGLYLGEEFHHNAVRLLCSQIGNLEPGWDMAGLRRRCADLARAGELVLGGLPRLSLSVESVGEGFAALERPDEVLQVALRYAGSRGNLAQDG